MSLFRSFLSQTSAANGTALPSGAPASRAAASREKNQAGNWVTVTAGSRSPCPVPVPGVPIPSPAGGVTVVTGPPKLAPIPAVTALPEQGVRTTVGSIPHTTREVSLGNTAQSGKAIPVLAKSGTGSKETCARGSNPSVCRNVTYKAVTNIEMKKVEII